MDKKTTNFVILYLIIEILLILVGLIYVYVAGFCAPGSPCPDSSEIMLIGFALPIIFGILSPIVYVLIYKKNKKH